MTPRATATASRSSRSPTGRVTVTAGMVMVDTGETICTTGTGEIHGVVAIVTESMITHEKASRIDGCSASATEP